MIIRLCTFDSALRKKDRSASIRLTTMEEQSQQQMTDLDGMFQKHCVIAFKERDKPFTDAEINDLDAIDVDILDKEKSPSKRLRNVLWKLQEQELERKPQEPEFKEYYRIKMESIIEHLKSKLE